VFASIVLSRLRRSVETYTLYFRWERAGFWPGRVCNNQNFALVNFRLKISPLVATIFRSFSGNETSNWVTGWPSGKIFYFDARLLEVWGSNPGREKEICVHLVTSVMLYMLWLLYIEFQCVLLWFLARRFVAAIIWLLAFAIIVCVFIVLVLWNMWDSFRQKEHYKRATQYECTVTSTKPIFPAFVFKVMHTVILLTRLWKLLHTVAILSGGKCLNVTHDATGWVTKMASSSKSDLIR